MGGGSGRSRKRAGVPPVSYRFPCLVRLPFMIVTTTNLNARSAFSNSGSGKRLPRGCGRRTRPWPGPARPGPARLGVAEAEMGRLRGRLDLPDGRPPAS